MSTVNRKDKSTLLRVELEIDKLPDTVLDTQLGDLKHGISDFLLDDID